MITKVAFHTHISPVIYPKRVNHVHYSDLTDYSISKPNNERWRSAIARSPEFEGDWI